jgi:YggT family protein
VTPLLAIGRDDVANYVSTLGVVLIVLIFVRVVMSFLPQIPYYRWLDAFLTFVTQVTDPILNPLRRLLPAVRIGPAALDLSPIVAILIIGIVSSILANLIKG